MGKVKLQMNIFADGKVTVDFGGTNINWDEEIKAFGMENLDNVGTVMLGRVTAGEIAAYWGAVAADPTHQDHDYGKRVTAIPKVIFSNSLQGMERENATILSGDLRQAVETLKRETAEDIIVFGGASFASSLIRHDLIDEYALLVNPALAGKGLTIFDTLDKALPLHLIEARTFKIGNVLLKYGRKR